MAVVAAQPPLYDRFVLEEGQLPRDSAVLQSLTPRELEVLQAVASGLTNAEVARRLDVTVHAIKFHLAVIYRRLGVANRTEAAVAYYRYRNPGEATGAAG